MSLHTERMQILKMIESGQVSAEEGAKLLAALQSGRKEGSSQETTTARWFRVRVTDLKTGKSKVNVNIPMALVNVGIKMGARFVPEDEDLDWEHIADLARSGVQGKILDSEDEESQERVELFVE